MRHERSEKKKRSIVFLCLHFAVVSSGLQFMFACVFRAFRVFQLLRHHQESVRNTREKFFIKMRKIFKYKHCGIKFHLALNDDKFAKYAKFIQKHGGEVYSSRAEGIFTFTSQYDRFCPYETHKIKYVVDCVKAKKLLNLDDYLWIPKKIFGCGQRILLYKSLDCTSEETICKISKKGKQKPRNSEIIQLSDSDEEQKENLEKKKEKIESIKRRLKIKEVKVLCEKIDISQLEKYDKNVTNSNGLNNSKEKPRIEEFTENMNLEEIRENQNCLEESRSFERAKKDSFDTSNENPDNLNENLDEMKENQNPKELNKNQSNSKCFKRKISADSDEDFFSEFKNIKRVKRKNIRFQDSDDEFPSSQNNDKSKNQNKHQNSQIEDSEEGINAHLKRPKSIKILSEKQFLSLSSSDDSCLQGRSTLIRSQGTSVFTQLPTGDSNEDLFDETDTRENHTKRNTSEEESFFDSLEVQPSSLQSLAIRENENFNSENVLSQNSEDQSREDNILLQKNTFQNVSNFENQSQENQELNHSDSGDLLDKEDREALLNDSDTEFENTQIDVQDNNNLEDLDVQFILKVEKINSSADILQKDRSMCNIKSQIAEEASRFAEKGENCLETEKRFVEREKRIEEERNEIEKEKSKLEKERINLEEEKKTMEEERMNLDTEKSKMKGEKINLLKEKNIVRKEKRKIEEEIKNLDFEKRRMEEEKNNVAIEKRKMEEERNNLDLDEQRIVEERGTLEKKKHHLGIEKKKIEEIKKSLDLEKRRMEEGKRRMEEERKTLDLEKRRIVEERSHLEKGKNIAGIEKKKMEEERKNLDLEKKRMEDERQNMKLEKKRMEEEISDLKRRITENSRNELKNERRILENGQNSLKREEGVEQEEVICSIEKESQHFTLDLNSQYAENPIENYEKNSDGFSEAETIQYEDQLNASGNNELLDYNNKIVSNDELKTQWKQKRCELEAFCFSQEVNAGHEKEEEHKSREKEASTTCAKKSVWDDWMNTVD